MNLNRKCFGRLKKISLLAFFLIFLGTGGIYYYNSQRGNFHTVRENKVYRSGQLTALQLEFYVRDYGIRSVLNLRGKNESAGWWKDEVEASRSLGLKHYDLALSSKKEPTENQIRQLLAILNEAPKPILIHCQGGADRSGFASAVYLYSFEGYPYQEAKKQLSFLYGHVPVFRPLTRSMGTAFDRFCLNYKDGKI